jgi:autotransporter-associated beta strand protein
MLKNPMTHPPLFQIPRLAAAAAALLCPLGIAAAADSFTLGGSGSQIQLILGNGSDTGRTPKFTNNSGKTAVFASNVYWDTGGGKPSALTFDGSSDFVVAGQLFTNALTSNLTKTGNATLTLSANNTFSGGIFITGGTVAVGHDRALGTGTLTMNATTARIRSMDATARTLANPVTLSQNATFGAVRTGNLTFTGAVNAGTARTWTVTGITAGFSGAITGSSTQTTVGSGTLWWSGNNSATLTGAVSINGGTLRVSHGNALGSTGSGTTIKGSSTAMLEITGGISTAENIAIGGKNNLSITLRNVSGNNTLTGNTTLGGGGVEYNIESAAGSLTINSNLTTQASSVRTLNISGAGNVSLGGIIADNNNVNRTIGIQKTGEGTLTLSGNNTYTENTTVNAGTLVLANTGGLRFKIGAAGVNNTLGGTGTATLDGKFIFNLASAGKTVGNAWTIVEAGLGESYGGTFAVASTNGPFTNNSGIWTRSEKGVTYRFEQSTGVLSVITPPAGYASWASGFTNPALGVTASTGDPDHDGLTNAVEYALGLDPRYFSGSPGAVTNNGKTITFTKGALAKVDAKVTYQIETSATLGASPSPWTAGSAPLVTETPDTISITFPEGPQNFARLKVTLAP